MMPDMSLALEKLTIEIETDGHNRFGLVAKVLYNPKQFSITKVAWKTDTKEGLLPADSPETLSVELFFDTSLPPVQAGPLPASLTQSILGRSQLYQTTQPQNVRDHTEQIMYLTQPSITAGKDKRPPICRLRWGKNQDIFFQGVLTDVTQTFSKFLLDGTPIRATLGCKFEAWEDPNYKEKARNPIDDPIRVVQRGDTLSSIAQEEYGDAALWRIIAEENRLTHPRQLNPGQRLTVPPLRLAGRNRRRDQ